MSHGAKVVWTLVDEPEFLFVVGSWLAIFFSLLFYLIRHSVIFIYLSSSLTREHTTTVDLELMAATPPASCPSGYPLGVGPNGGGSLLDASPTSSCCDNMSNNHCHPQQHHNNIGSGGGADPSYLSSQGCDVVMQTGSLGRRNERYNNTRQVHKALVPFFSENANDPQIHKKVRDVIQAFPVFGTYPAFLVDTSFLRH